MSMVDVVAQAIWSQDLHGAPSWAQVNEMDRPMYRRMAQAAIDALNLVPVRRLDLGDCSGALADLGGEE